MLGRCCRLPWPPRRLAAARSASTSDSQSVHRRAETWRGPPGRGGARPLARRGCLGAVQARAERLRCATARCRCGEAPDESARRVHRRGRRLLMDEPPTGIDRIEADSSSTQSGDGSGTVNGERRRSRHRDQARPVGPPRGRRCRLRRPQEAYRLDDQGGHGTHVAGTIAARMTDTCIPNDPLEIVGVVPGAPLWAVRVAGKNGHGKGRRSSAASTGSLRHAPMPIRATTSPWRT